MNNHFVAVLVMLQTWLAQPVRRNERGSVSVEQAIVTGAIALLAAAVVAAITAFAMGKLSALGG